MEPKILVSSLFLMLVLCPTHNECYRILVVFPMNSKSHNILGQGVVNNLLEAGHEVVFFTAFPKPEPVTNLTEIDCSEIGAELRKEADKSGEFKLKNLVGKGNIDSRALLQFISEFHKAFLEYEPVQKFLSDPHEKFDLVILEWFFSEVVAGIPPLFQCPFIWIGSTEAHGQILRLIDEVPNPAYSADLFSSNAPPFTMWERVEELYMAARRFLLTHFVVHPTAKSDYERIFPEIAEKRGVELPLYDHAIYRASMLLLNSHPSVGTPYRLPQNVKYIGGYHIDKQVNPLPEDIRQILDESKAGVIYFSMGSNLFSKDMSTEMKESLLNMFGNLKEDVIWKFEDDLQNVPDNVYLVKWAPQQSILAHPNLKLFVTHGGQLSTTEAIHFGVPVVGLPVLGDQYINMRSVVNKGFGVMVAFSDYFTEDLRAAIENVLEDPAYRRTAEYLSKVYHHRLAAPGDELVHWVEHVVKTGGAPHLISPGFHLYWMQKYYLDVLMLMILACYLMKWQIWDKCTRSNRRYHKYYRGDTQKKRR